METAKQNPQKEMVEITDNYGNKKKILRSKCAFMLKEAKTEDGQDVLLASDAVYMRGRGNMLIRLDKKKLGKAAKKAAKRERVKNNTWPHLMKQQAAAGGEV